jgi:hypothetical protein
MEPEVLIELAQKAGFREANDDGVWITDGYWDEQLQRFAEMVADRERERAAMICHQCRDWEYASEEIAYRILNQGRG